MPFQVRHEDVARVFAVRDAGAPAKGGEPVSTLGKEIVRRYTIRLLPAKGLTSHDYAFHPLLPWPRRVVPDPHARYLEHAPRAGIHALLEEVEEDQTP